MTTPQQQPYQAPSADDFLMGGGGAPTGKFPHPGTTISGRITEKPKVEQQRDIKDGSLKFWGDGNPMMQLVVTLQTTENDPQIEEDDGRRRIFVKGQMKNVIADAVRSTGARGLEVGGTLTVTYTHDGQSKGPGMSPPKQYTAAYIAAAANALNTPDPGTQAVGAPPTAAPGGTPGYAAHTPAPGTPATPATAPASGNPGVPGLTPEQMQAAMANPATAALLAQQQAAQAAAGNVPAF